MTLPKIYKNIPYNERWKVREEYIKLQKNLCIHCKEPLDSPPSKEVQDLWINTRLFPKNFLERPVHLHHDHESGYTIGVVHSRCNAVLWQYYGE